MYFPFRSYAVCPEMLILCSWRLDFRVHGGDESMAQKMFSLQRVAEVAADPDSEDDFDGEWYDEDGKLNLHDGDVSCVTVVCMTFIVITK